jgi:hypothetical protein
MAGVFPCQAEHRLGEYLAVARRCPVVLLLGGHAVEVNGVTLGGLVALALGGDDMDKSRPRVVPRLGEGFLQGADIVPVYRPDIGEAEFLPEHGGHYQALESPLEPLAQLPQLFAQGENIQHSLALGLCPLIAVVEPDPTQQLGQAADGG